MNLLDVLSTSPHYFCGKWIRATNENSNVDLRFKGLEECINNTANARRSTDEQTCRKLKRAVNVVLENLQS